MEDLISRQAAIEALCNDYCGGHQDCKYYPNCENLKSIEQLPPIQPKRGKWHYSDGKPARIGLSFGVVCDQCGTESEYCTNFCGECGADMREVTT